MLAGRILAEDGQFVLLPHVLRTTNALERLRGLLFRKPLKSGEGLLIDPCNSVHMFGMRYSIDLLYLDRDWRVLKTVNSLEPWRLSGCRGAAMTLEMPVGSLQMMDVAAGCVLRWGSR